MADPLCVRLELKALLQGSVQLSTLLDEHNVGLRSDLPEVGLEQLVPELVDPVYQGVEAAQVAVRLDQGLQVLELSLLQVQGFLVEIELLGLLPEPAGLLSQGLQEGQDLAQLLLSIAGVALQLGSYPIDLLVQKGYFLLDLLAKPLLVLLKGHVCLVNLLPKSEKQLL